ncbi:hypothetical protein ACSBR2_013966 [Camellia fascicularis]
MAISGGKAIFINGHDVSSIEKTGANIAELLLKAIDYVGPSNVVQVVTDNASNCKTACEDPTQLFTFCLTPSRNRDHIAYLISLSMSF